MTRGVWGSSRVTVEFGARRDTRSGRVACANNGSAWRFCTLLVQKRGSITRKRLRGGYIESTCSSAANSELFNCALLDAQEKTAMRTVLDLVLCSQRRPECIRAITGRYLLQDHFVARISRGLRLWSSTRDDATVSGSWRRRLTVHRIANMVRDTVAAVTARHDCTGVV